MSMLKINWKPTPGDLGNFGRIALAASLLVALVLHAAKGLGLQWCAVIVGAGLVVFLCSLFSMKLTKWIYLGLTILTFPIGMAISSILLAAFYFLLLAPVGLVFRLIRRDSMRRKWDADAGSYWIPRRPSDNIKRYFNQF